MLCRARWCWWNGPCQMRSGVGVVRAGVVRATTYRPTTNHQPANHQIMSISSTSAYRSAVTKSIHASPAASRVKHLQSCTPVQCGAPPAPPPPLAHVKLRGSPGGMAGPQVGGGRGRKGRAEVVHRGGAGGAPQTGGRGLCTPGLCGRGLMTCGGSCSPTAITCTKKARSPIRIFRASRSACRPCGRGPQNLTVKT